MRELRRTLTLALVLGGLATAATADETLLYAPKATGQEAAPASPADGVLVKRITISRGDTLAKLSRSYNGKGSYYPQILLFNDIANPDLIYAGRTLLVPIAPRRAEPAPAAPKVKKSAVHRRTVKRQAVAPARLAAATPATSPAAMPAAEQTLYRKALRAYQREQYRQALAGFNRFLSRYPKSSLAPDAALYKADSLLKLAGE